MGSLYRLVRQSPQRLDSHLRFHKAPHLANLLPWELLRLLGSHHPWVSNQLLDKHLLQPAAVPPSDSRLRMVVVVAVVVLRRSASPHLSVAKSLPSVKLRPRLLVSQPLARRQNPRLVRLRSLLLLLARHQHQVVDSRLSLRQRKPALVPLQRRLPTSLRRLPKLQQLHRVSQLLPLASHHRLEVANSHRSRHPLSDSLRRSDRTTSSSNSKVHRLLKRAVTAQQARSELRVEHQRTTTTHLPPNPPLLQPSDNRLSPQTLRSVNPHSPTPVRLGRRLNRTVPARLASRMLRQLHPHNLRRPTTPRKVQRKLTAARSVRF